ncbi:MAG TPA: dual specificity protein phosphatase family protein [Candidatus Acidoferrales bacterium]|jgi:atypical dual specificity phosphatase|nr:dual specificity protein phosphatase family protein [Candidatus Acidoferrales bacterium]
MNSAENNSLIWWAVPGVLAGMPMPYVRLDRRLAGGGKLTAFDDELPILWSAGVRAVVSLLNIPTDATVYESTGFAFLCLPVSDGGAPTFEQAGEFVRFVKFHRAAGRPVSVHCEAGLGRTGTLLTTFLIADGESAAKAIERIRASESSTVESNRQIIFLEQYSKYMSDTRCH